MSVWFVIYMAGTALNILQNIFILNSQTSFYKIKGIQIWRPKRFLIELYSICRNQELLWCQYCGTIVVEWSSREIEKRNSFILLELTINVTRFHKRIYFLPKGGHVESGFWNGSTRLLHKCDYKFGAVAICLESLRQARGERGYKCVYTYVLVADSRRSY